MVLPHRWQIISRRKRIRYGLDIAFIIAISAPNFQIWIWIQILLDYSLKSDIGCESDISESDMWETNMVIDRLNGYAYITIKLS